MSKAIKNLKFTICPHEIYDHAISSETWPIGIKASYPATLLQNIWASSLACSLQIQSVDYVRKKYLSDWPPDFNSLNSNNIDVEITHSLSQHIDTIQEYLYHNSYNLIHSNSHEIAGITLAKAICRNSLEMLNWVCQIFDLSDLEDPFDYRPEKNFKIFQQVYVGVGRYYGYLSGYLHWRPKMHPSIFCLNPKLEEETLESILGLEEKNEKESSLGIIQGSGAYKWESIANIILILILYVKVYFLKHEKLCTLKGKKNLTSKIRAIYRQLCSTWDKWMLIYKQLDEPYLSKDFFRIVTSKEIKLLIAKN